MRSEGMHATVSSIHVNGWYGGHNKLEGARWIVGELWGRRLDDELPRWAYVGDSTNDALMFDWRGRIAEATGANVFFVRDGELHTPTPDCFLDGITRRTIKDLAVRRGIKVSERAIWPEELESFEQMFLTGTAVELTPVQSAGPWNFQVGEMTRQLAKDYDDLVNGRIPNA